MLHDGHPGITKMLRLARQYFWWPGIDQDINGFVQRCNICQTYARRTTRRGLSSWPEAKDFLDRVQIWLILKTKRTLYLLTRPQIGSMCKKFLIFLRALQFKLFAVSSNTLAFLGY